MLVLNGGWLQAVAVTAGVAWRNLYGCVTPCRRMFCEGSGALKGVESCYGLNSWCSMFLGRLKGFFLESADWRARCFVTLLACWPIVRWRGSVVSGPRRLICLWRMCNGLTFFQRISLRNASPSGAIDPTSRKGVGPGLWGCCKGESPTQSSRRSPMFNLGETLK